MSNAFNNFLGGVVNGLFGKGPIMKDYQHADRVYVKNNYARAPKLGFLYFVTFNLNLDALPATARWSQEGYKEVGLLVKKIDLPKFTVTNETLNQYNRKTVVQTTLKYNPISIEFHDDNSNITRDMWKTYFQYYYADSVYGNNISNTSTPIEFENTKYNPKSHAYGLNSNQNKPFIRSIDIFVLHQQNFTQYTLVNPIINDWNHDSLDQADGTKILTNKMGVSYETVLYKEGRVNSSTPERFSAVYYDTSPSPLSISGNGTNSLFGAGGIIAGAGSVLGALQSGNILGAAIQGANVLRNARSITKGGLKQEGYSILTGVLGNVQQTGNQPGGIGAAVQTGINQRGLGINIFSNQNNSVNGSIPTTPSKLTGTR
jgi:hypothetical protein